MRPLVTCLLLFVLPVVSHSATLQVPKDHASIQAAIDGANPGDTVLVSPGAYKENINFKGKAIAVKSEKGPDLTIIDGNQMGSVVTFESKEGLDSVLEGFCVTNGSGTLAFPPTQYLGGGIYCRSGSSPTIVKCRILGNSVNGLGGGLYTYFSAPTIDECEISGNTAGRGAGGQGGGIYFEGSPSYPIVQNCVISKNTAYSTGGGIFCDNASPMVKNSIFTENTAHGAGGGIFCDHASPTVKNNMISMNKAHTDGGGIYCNALCQAKLMNNTILDNSVKSNGGGVCCKSVSPFLMIKGNTISNNKAKSAGGGIYLSGASPSIKNNFISHNGVGGNSVVSGAGIYLWDSNSYLINNIIWSNEAISNMASYGGGISCCGESKAKILNNTIIENVAKGHQGFGGGICCTEGATLTIANTIQRDNQASARGPEMWIGDYGQKSTVTIISSNLRGGPSFVYVNLGCQFTFGSGMIDSDPLFVKPWIGDFHLTHPSPCRDTGNNNHAGGVSHDFEGDPRKAFGIVDMGADEFHTHLYFTGAATPGGMVEVKLVGLPGTSPAVLWVGSGVLQNPIPTLYGDWFLEFPILVTLNLGAIASPSGVSVLPYFFYPSFPAMEISLQAGIGSHLTNLCEMKIK